MALFEALREQTQAAQEGRREDVVRWSVLAAQAARDIGRVAEALTHAQWALDTATSLNDPGLLSHARYGMAVALKAERDYDGALRELRAGRDRMQEACLWNAFRILTELAAPLEPADATMFWRLGARRVFLESVRTQFGGQFLKKVMEEGNPDAENATRIIQGIGFDPSTIP